jgi:hypothetical protein
MDLSYRTRPIVRSEGFQTVEAVRERRSVGGQAFDAVPCGVSVLERERYCRREAKPSKVEAGCDRGGRKEWREKIAAVLTRLDAD